MSTSIYVGNLPYTLREDYLEELFSQYGEIVSVRVVTDRETGRSKGFGFVEMADKDSADKAIEALNGYETDGRPLKVNEARPRENRRPRF
jgi:RNA recognition motif-containing protein